MLSARPLDAVATYRLLASTDLSPNMTTQEWQAAFDTGQFVGFVAEEGEREAGVLVVELRTIDDIHIHIFEGNNQTRAFLMRQLLTKAKNQCCDRLAQTQAPVRSPAHLM